MPILEPQGAHNGHEMGGQHTGYGKIITFGPESFIASVWYAFQHHTIETMSYNDGSGINYSLGNEAF